MSQEQDIPQEYLELFDNLDLEEQSERRAATRAIVDFYGTLLSEVGKSSLGFKPDDLSQGVGPQWNKARDRLRSIEDIDIPEDYSRVLNRLHTLQNDVDHQFGHNPEREMLEEARELAEEWAIWFLTKGREYETTVGEQSAQETMIRLTQQTLGTVQQSPDSYGYNDLEKKQADINQEAEQLSDRVTEISESTDAISNELVFLMADSLSLEQSYESVQGEYTERKEREKRLQEERDRQNTVPCYVTEPYDEYGNITVVTDEVGKEDQTLVISANHPDVPNETFEQLQDLEPNMRYGITFDYDRNRTRYVKAVSRQ